MFPNYFVRTKYLLIVSFHDANLLLKQIKIQMYTKTFNNKTPYIPKLKPTLTKKKKSPKNKTSASTP